MNSVEADKSGDEARTSPYIAVLTIYFHYIFFPIEGFYIPGPELYLQ